MVTTSQAAGAMPVASGAMPGQSYPFGSGWAAYRLPFPGLNGTVTPREVGIGFEGEPAAGGATPPAATPPAATPPATPPATGDDGLGDAGKRAIAEERAARKAAEDAAKAARDELEQLKAANQSEADKALDQARKTAAKEVADRLGGQILRSEIRTALLAKGINPAVLDLAVKADEFAKVKVSDEGVVDATALGAAIDAFAAAKADLFKTPPPAGSADGGSRGGGKTVTRDQLKTMTPAEINAAFERGELDAVLGRGR